jgi:hypothetical protein
MRESRDFIANIASSTLSRNGIPGDYSRFKLGSRKEIAGYAHRICDRLLSLLSPVIFSDTWIITGPPMTAIPSAANLLAEDLVARLVENGCTGVSLRNLRKTPDVGRFPNHHYAELDIQSRERALRDAMANSWCVDEGLSGASMIVVDDVLVTGTNELVLRDFLGSARVERVHWQYILNYDLDSGSRAEVEEPRLNGLSMNDGGMARMLREDEFSPTTRLIWSLFAMAPERYFRMVTEISPSTAASILKLIEQEGIDLGSDARQRELVARSRGGYAS